MLFPGTFFLRRISVDECLVFWKKILIAKSLFRDLFAHLAAMQVERAWWQAALTVWCWPSSSMLCVVFTAIYT